MQVRRVSAEEYDAVGELTVAAYEAFLAGPQDFYRERLADVARRDAEAEVWVAVDGPVESPVLLGNVTLCPPGSPWSELAEPGEGEFRMLAVAPAAQGRGVGRALALFVVDRFRTEGARGMVLSSLAEMTAAHRVYERLGFVRAAHRDWSPAPGVDLIAYTLEF